MQPLSLFFFSQLLIMMMNTSISSNNNKHDKTHRRASIRHLIPINTAIYPNCMLVGVDVFIIVVLLLVCGLIFFGPKIQLRKPPTLHKRDHPYCFHPLWTTILWGKRMLNHIIPSESATYNSIFLNFTMNTHQHAQNTS